MATQPQGAKPMGDSICSQCHATDTTFLVGDQFLCTQCATAQLHQMVAFEAQLTQQVDEYLEEMHVEQVRQSIKDLAEKLLAVTGQTVMESGRQVYYVEARPAVKRLI